MIFSRVVRIVGIVVLVAAACTAAALFRTPPAPTPASVAGPDASGTMAPMDAKALYLDRCAGCHGDFGQGTYAPELRNGLVVASFPNRDDQIAMVSNGRGSMRPFGTELTPAQIAAVVDYTRGL